MRPKCPEKERITVTILKSTSEILRERAGEKPLLTYLAECLEVAARPNHVEIAAGRALVDGKSYPVRPVEVEPRFKKAAR